MTRDELTQARLQWLTSAVRGLLKARYGPAQTHNYYDSEAGKIDEELRKEEAKHDVDLNLGPALLRYIRSRAEQMFKDFVKEQL